MQCVRGLYLQDVAEGRALNLPAGQREHVAAPGLLNRPGGHSAVHTEVAWKGHAPYRPAGQGALPRPTA